MIFKRFTEYMYINSYFVYVGTDWAQLSSCVFAVFERLWNFFVWSFHTVVLLPGNPNYTQRLWIWLQEKVGKVDGIVAEEVRLRKRAEQAAEELKDVVKKREDSVRKICAKYDHLVRSAITSILIPSQLRTW